jgi:hypothetical protein
MSNLISKPKNYIIERRANSAYCNFIECPMHYHSACSAIVALNNSNADNRCCYSTAI